MVGIGERRGIPGCLSVGLAHPAWTPLHDLLRLGLDKEEVLVGVGWLLAAVVLLVCRVLWWTLAAAGAPVTRAGGTASVCPRTGRHTTRGALGGLPAGAQGLGQDGQAALKPVVGWGWTQPTWPAGQRLQGGRLLRDQEAEALDCARRPCPGGAAALPLPDVPLLRQGRRLLGLLGHLQGRQPLLKRVHLESCCGQQCTWLDF